MRISRTLFASAAIVAAFGTRAGAQNDARGAVLVTAQWVEQHVRDANLVLLHVGTQAEYDAAHLPGARFITINDLAVPRDTTPGTRTLEMLPPDALRAKLASFGISDDSRIVVYVGADRVTQATRVFETLQFAGLGARASLLDGGMPAWVAAGFATSKDVPAPKQGTLSALRTQATTVTGEWVRDNATKSGYALVDARLTPFYTGAQMGGPRGAQRNGHIPGAFTIPFDSLWTSTNTLKPEAELRAMFEKAGVKPGDTVVGYCHIGQQATAMLFAARALGFKTLLYDGSFEDWAFRDWPVETAPNPKKQ